MSGKGRPVVLPTAMVCTPEPGMLKSIRSGPGFWLASRMACRSEPAPKSRVLVTNITVGRQRSSSASSRGLRLERRGLGFELRERAEFIQERIGITVSPRRKDLEGVNTGRGAYWITG